MGIKTLQYFLLVGKGKGLEKSKMLSHLPVASDTGISIPWASFFLTIKGNKAPRIDSQPVPMCSVGFCMFMEGKSF